MEIYEFLERSTKLDLDWLAVEIMAIISDNEDFLLNLLDEQWDAGQNEDGDAVGRYKWSTEHFYSILDPPSSGNPKKEGQPYNLNWHGYLFRGLNFNFEYAGDELFLLIDSSGATKQPLFMQIKREGLVQDPNSIFGLQAVNLGKVNEMTNEQIINKFYEFLKIN